MSEPSDDKTLDEYLKGGSAVSQRYRELAANQVPPQLDRRVLAQAHAAVGRDRRWMRWSKPIALAATVVLAVAIVMESGIERTAMEATQPTRESQAHVPVNESATSAREDAAPEADAMSGETAPMPAAPEPVPPAAAAREERSAAPALEQTRAIDAAENRADYEPALSPPPPQPQGVRSNSVQASALAAAAAPDELDGGIQQSSGQQEVVTSGNPAQRSPEHKIGPHGTISRDGLRRDAQQVDMPEHADPDRWLEEIRQLRRAGKLQQADREWERFLAVFPDHPVAPDDLARKLP